MTTTKKFSVCGTSKLNGEYKVRFANDALRIKVLAKHGHSDINLVELAEPMTKVEAARLIQGLEVFAGKNEQAAIADYLERKDEVQAGNKNKPGKEPKKPAQQPKKATVAAVVKTDKAPAAKTVKTEQNEDAPF